MKLFTITERTPDAVRFVSNVNGRRFSLAYGDDGLGDLIELTGDWFRQIYTGKNYALLCLIILREVLKKN